METCCLRSSVSFCLVCLVCVVSLFLCLPQVSHVPQTRDLKRSGVVASQNELYHTKHTNKQSNNRLAFCFFAFSLCHCLRWSLSFFWVALPPASQTNQRKQTKEQTNKDKSQKRTKKQRKQTPTRSTTCAHTSR